MVVCQNAGTCVVRDGYQLDVRCLRHLVLFENGDLSPNLEAGVVVAQGLRNFIPNLSSGRGRRFALKLDLDMQRRFQKSSRRRHVAQPARIFC